MINQIFKLLPRSRFVRNFFVRQIHSWLKDLASIVPTKSTITRFRSGSTFSRAIRHVFEHKSVNKFLGSNIALAVLATSILQVPQVSNNSVIIEPDTVIHTNTLAFKTTKGIHYPLDLIKINQKFHIFHPGIDFDGEIGDPIRPVMAGKVNSIQHSRFAYGNAVIIDHGSGLTTLYAHLSKIYVEAGEEVSGNTIIGAVGSTGRSTGSHLHLEVREDGRAINPLILLPH